MEWTKPKPKALAAAANVRGLEQSGLSLAENIDKATILRDQCEYLPEDRDRLLRDDAGRRQEAIEIAQNGNGNGSV